MPRNYTFGSEDPLCDTEIDSVTSSAQVPCCSKPQTNSCCPSCWPSLTRQLSGSTPPRNSKTPQWLLIFIAAGILQTVIAFLVGAIYFSIRALTSSLEHIETIPTYANGILLLCTGILVIVLYKKRGGVLPVTTLVLNLVCCALLAASAILVDSRSLQTLSRFEFCQYNEDEETCHCYIPVTAVTDQEYKSQRTKSGELEFVFQSCPSCVAIEYNLHDYLLALCILYAIGVLVCLVVLAALCILKFSEHQSDDQDTEVLNLELISHEDLSQPSTLQRAPLRNPPRRGRPQSEMRLFPRISLPGMDERLLQSMELPGNEQARLLRIQRFENMQNQNTDNVQGDDPSRGLSSTHQRTSHQRYSSDFGFNPRRNTSLNQHREIHRSQSDTSSSWTERPRHPRYPSRLSALNPAHLPQLYSLQRQQHFLRPDCRRGRTPHWTRSSCPTDHHVLRSQHRLSAPYHMSYLNLMDHRNNWHSARTESYASPFLNEPPPPYTDFELPMYTENEPAPSYRSRASPVPSV